MSIQMTSGRGTGVLGGYAPEPVCLYDTVDGMAFGPTFDSREEAAAFLRWLDKETGGAKPSSLTADKAVADQWRALLEEHEPEQCPYDDPDVGVGFLADRDASDGSGAYTPTCSCECHDRAVRFAEDKWDREAST